MTFTPSDPSAPPAPPEKPTARALFRAGWRFVWSNTRAVAAAAATPFLLTLVVNLGAAVALREELDPARVQQLATVLGIVPATMLGVVISRLVLLGDIADETPLWSAAHTRYAAFTFAWQAPFLVLGQFDVAAFASQPAAVALFSLAVVLMIFLYPRFAIFLPAAAVQRPLSLADAWRRSRGYGVAIFWGQFLCMLGALVFLPPAIVLTVVLVATQGAESELIPTVYVVLLMVPAQILVSAMLAFAYGMIEQRRV